MSYKKVRLIAQVSLWLLLIISLFIFSIPFLIMISASMDEFSYVLPYPPKIIPPKLEFSAYQHILQLPLFTRAFLNSVINTIVTVIISLIISTLSAYGFAKINFPGRKWIFILYIFTLMVPGFLNIIPQFIVLRGIEFIPGMPNGLIGTTFGLILIYTSTSIAGHTFFLRNYFRTIPDSLSESVYIDGGGHFTIFRHIYLPLSLPAIATMSIFSFQGYWEEYFTAKVLIGANEDLITLPLLLQRLNGEYATRWDLVFAASILTLIPVMLIYITFQKKLIVGNLTQGSVKE